MPDYQNYHSLKKVLILSYISYFKLGEELRLIILKLLRQMIKSYPTAMENSLKEIGLMLSKCLTDAFPTAKKV